MKVENFTTDEQERCRLDIFKKESPAKIDYIESEPANALKQKEEFEAAVVELNTHIEEFQVEEILTFKTICR